jgi:hypothetical protein
MIVGGVIALIFGVDAERRSLESITDPLSKVEARADGTSGTGRGKADG